LYPSPTTATPSTTVAVGTIPPLDSIRASHESWPARVVVETFGPNIFVVHALQPVKSTASATAQRDTFDIRILRSARMKPSLTEKRVFSFV
jgi:hypothetical protein